MTYNIAINQVMMMKWDLSFKACAILHKMVDLSSWADAIHVDKKTYYVLYRNKMLDELPCIGTSLSTVSKYIQELEQKKIIESVNKSTVPAYRLTTKGRQWISDTKNEKTNDGENKDEIVKPKKFTFRLTKDTEYPNLTLEYQENLKKGALVYAAAKAIPEIEYENFLNFKKSGGKKHKDWASAFKTWCSNYHKWNKEDQNKNSNGGENYFSGVDGR